MDTKYLYGCGILFGLGFDIKETNIWDSLQSEKLCFQQYIVQSLAVWLLFWFLLKKIMMRPISVPLYIYNSFAYGFDSDQIFVFHLCDVCSENIWMETLQTRYSDTDTLHNSRKIIRKHWKFPFLSQMWPLKQGKQFASAIRNTKQQHRRVLFDPDNSEQIENI